MGNLKITQFALEINYANAFLAVDPARNEGFLVDCGALEAQITNSINDSNIKLKFLLLTHSHHDHVGGVSDFKQEFRAPIYSATNDYDKQVLEGEEILFGEYRITVLATPGHTPDGLSFFVDQAVFVGDAIFSGAVGGTVSRERYEEETEHVRQKVLSLPDDTVIYPGHGAPSLVGIERLFNPFFD